MIAALLAGFLVLVLAGVVKGVIGMGLPTVGVGLLSLLLSPAEAAAVLIVPSAVTNVWQFFTGPQVGAVSRRFLVMMAGVFLGTLAGGFWLGGLSTAAALPALGVTLALYGALGLSRLPLRVPLRLEPLLSPVMGVLTGLVTGTTGVAVMPSAPYLQALGLGRDELVQGLGLTFTVSTFALALTMVLPAADGTLAADPTLAVLSLAALAPAFAGMEIGRRLRLAIAPALFRRVFFASLLLLGLYMAGRGLL